MHDGVTLGSLTLALDSPLQTVDLQTGIVVVHPFAMLLHILAKGLYGATVKSPHIVQRVDTDTRVGHMHIIRMSADETLQECWRVAGR